MDLHQTAVHEAGHVVVAYALGLACKEVALTHDDVEETGQYGRAVGPNPQYGYGHGSQREQQETMRLECVACCAGLAAEHVFYSVPLDIENESAQGDFLNIIECERNGLRTRRGCSGFVGDDATWRFIARLLREAKKLVRRHCDTIQRLADTLVEKKQLSGDEVEQLLSEWMPR